MKKAVFFDVDGTLIDTFGGVINISSNVKAELQNLKSKGCYIFIATGRPYAFINKELLELEFDGFVLANGAHVIIDGETVHSKPIDNEFIKRLTSTLENKDIDYILVDDKHSYIKKDSEELFKFYDLVGTTKDSFKKYNQIEGLNIHKVEMLCPNKEILDYCLDFIKDNPDYGYFNSIENVHLEIHYKESTKAAGILKAIEHLGVKIEDTYAFGDGKNDIEMLSTVGCGIAMGNAADDVKKYAKEITDTVCNDGVAKGIQKYILNSI
ncbi:HAD family hydrolase [Clostridium sp.]|uniref:HAD family hydrolase n=1 Tax=Clostridium sp. TaxID=1506 RepID=UPI003F3B8CF3